MYPLHRPTYRYVLSTLVPLLVANVHATRADAVQLQSWVATSQIQSGNTTLTQAPAPPSPSGPDVSTGFLEANGSSAAYFDDLSVTSSTLPVGTPVTVRFVFDLGFTAGVASTLDQAIVSTQISSTAAGVQGLAAGSNRHFEDLDSGTFIQNGLFTAPHHAEYTISTTVGATFSFNVTIQSSSGGTVRVTGSLGNEINHLANDWSSVGVSFGGEVVGADAQLVSGLLADPFPAASETSPANAEAAVPANPFEVPEPGVAGMLMIGSLARSALERDRRKV